MPRTPFPSFDKLLEAANEVAARFTGRVVLGGGLAMQFHGSPRLTAGVDLVAEGSSNDWPEAPETLTFGGGRGFASNGVPVDVIVRADEWAPLYFQALGNAAPVEGAPLAVITPEYLVPIKMVAGRPKDETDVLFLLGSGIDVVAGERIVRAHLGAFGVSEFKNLLWRTEWLRERER